MQAFVDRIAQTPLDPYIGAEKGRTQFVYAPDLTYYDPGGPPSLKSEYPRMLWAGGALGSPQWALPSQNGRGEQRRVPPL